MADLIINWNRSLAAGADTQMGAVPNHILPMVITKLRNKLWLLRTCQTDFQPIIAQYGDRITIEKILGTPTVQDFGAADVPLTATNMTITNDEAVLDRWIGVCYSVSELALLLPQNGSLHWNAFQENTIDVIAEYVETDLLSLYALMTNTYAINGPLTKADIPRIRLTMKRASKRPGPWIFLISDYDETNLLEDKDLINWGFSNDATLLRDGNIMRKPLYNYNIISHSLIPEVGISSPSGYNTMCQNIAYAPEAIQFFSRNLGMPKIQDAGVTIGTITDPESGIQFRMRILYTANTTQPKYTIVLEILYGIKLFRDEFACNVTTLHQV
jgi:hypothetical protein